MQLIFTWKTIQAIVVWPAIAVEPECGYKFSELEQQLEYFRSTFSLFKYEPLTFDGIKPTSNETWTAKVIIENSNSDVYQILHVFNQG